MIYSHNNAIVQGKPWYETKLNALKHHQISNSDEQYLNRRFQLTTPKKHKWENDPIPVTPVTIPSKSIKNEMFLHRKANKWENKCSSIPVDKAINMTKMSSHLVRLEAALCVQVKSKFIPFLLDSGSDANILSYNSFTEIGFRIKFLDNSTKYNIKSSQGYQEDVILGTFFN